MYGAEFILSFTEDVFLKVSFSGGEQRLQTPAIKEVNLCGREIQAGGQRQREVWKVDEDEETAMFGERTDANLYLANWNQQRPTPEPHSGPQHRARWEGLGGVNGGLVGSFGTEAYVED